MDSLVLGLCTDNVVTVLHPSSTIECSCSNIQTGTVALGTSFFVPAPTLVTGYITATVATGTVTVTLNGTTINTPYVVAPTATIPFTFFSSGNVTLAVAGATGTVTYQYLT